MGRKILRKGAALGAMLLLSGTGAFAANTGSNLPWEGPLQTLVTSLTGPVAYAISIVAIVALGAGLAFGGEMSESMRRMLQVGIAVCLVVFAAQVMTSWIGSGAETTPASIVPAGLMIAAFFGLAALMAWVAQHSLAAVTARARRAKLIPFSGAASSRLKSRADVVRQTGCLAASFSMWGDSNAGRSTGFDTDARFSESTAIVNGRR